jgi:hypothetical protein
MRRAVVVHPAAVSTGSTNGTADRPAAVSTGSTNGTSPAHDPLDQA